jgi:beta-N-acetylhexosaminidase
LRKDYDGLIITDEIRMLGLQSYYNDPQALYADVFTVPNDMVLFFTGEPKEVYAFIQTVKSAVQDGRISEARLDDSVRRVLAAKGIPVID